jgi:hypothetical protein
MGKKIFQFFNNVYILLLVLVSIEIKASDDLEVHNMSEMLNAIHLEKKQIELMVSQMNTTGRLTADESAKVKREVASIKESDVEVFKSNVIKIIGENSH